MNLKLRAKLLLAFFLLIMLPCTVLGFLSYRQASRALRNTIENQLQSTVSTTAELVNSAIGTSLKLVEVASDKTEFITAAVTGDDGPAVSAAQSLLKMNSGLIDDVAVIDRNGRVVCTLAGGKNISVKERNYFIQAIGGQQATSGVVISKTTNKPIIAVAQPLRQGGQIVGVLAVMMDFNALTKKVSTLKIADTGYGYMLDKSGLFVYHPNKDMVLKENILHNQNEDVKALGRKMVEGQTGMGFYSFQGLERLVAYAPAGQFAVAMTAPVNEYMAPARTILRNTAAIMLSAIIIALLIAFGVANSIVKPVARLRELMAAAGDGNLTVVSGFAGKDEIGDLSRSFDIMIASQKNIVKEVRSASIELAKVSEAMAASCEEVTSTSEEIASSMQVVTSEANNGNASMLQALKSLERLSGLIQTAKTEANAAAANSQATYRAAEEGRDKVTETVAKMQAIKDQTQEASKIIGKLSEQSQQIVQIVDTITAIAAQTNLLALNAAIEAARAGEHGRGFAVVAEEVRKLAEQSNQRAKEITALIREVEDNTQQAVGAMSNNTEQVESGVAVVMEAGKALDRILEAVRNTVAGIEEINQVAAEEAAYSEQIVKLINQLAAVIEIVASNCQQVATGTEQQASAMQTVSASSEETNAAANQMKNLVEKFKV